MSAQCTHSSSISRKSPSSAQTARCRAVALDLALAALVLAGLLGALLARPLARLVLAGRRSRTFRCVPMAARLCPTIERVAHPSTCSSLDADGDVLVWNNAFLPVIAITVLGFWD